LWGSLGAFGGIGEVTFGVDHRAVGVSTVCYLSWRQVALQGVLAWAAKEAGPRHHQIAVDETITSPRASSTPRLRPGSAPPWVCSIRRTWGNWLPLAQPLGGCHRWSRRQRRRPHNASTEASRVSGSSRARRQLSEDRYAVYVGGIDTLGNWPIWRRQSGGAACCCRGR